MDDPKFGGEQRRISPSRTVIGKVSNPEGGIVYNVLDIDSDANVWELVDPHTKAAFILKNAKQTLEHLSYTLQTDDD